MPSETEKVNASECVVRVLRLQHYLESYALCGFYDAYGTGTFTQLFSVVRNCSHYIRFLIAISLANNLIHAHPF